MLDTHQSHWFETSFTQLPDVCQKQVGALVGALIADAAVNGIALESITDPREVDQLDLFQQPPSSLLLQNSTSRRGGKGTSSTTATISSISAEAHALDATLFNTWSPASVAAIDIVDTIDASKSMDVSVWHDAVGAAVRRAIDSMPPQVSSCRLAPANFAIFPVCASVPLATLYPWATDADAHTNVSAVLSAVAERDEEIRSSPRHQQFLVCPRMTEGEDEAGNASAAAVLEHYLAASSILLRSVQSNPDAVANTMLRLHGEASGFKFIPREASFLAQQNNNEDFCWQGSNDVLRSAWSILRSERNLLIRSGSQLLAERRGTPQDYGRVHGAGGSKNTDFERIVRRCLKETMRRRPPMLASGSAATLAAQLSSFVGACAGAHIGVRQLPPEWMAACDERTEGALSRAVASSVSVSRWLWNPEAQQ